LGDVPDTAAEYVEIDEHWLENEGAFQKRTLETVTP
jgi:hypothetical protein